MAGVASSVADASEAEAAELFAVCARAGIKAFAFAGALLFKPAELSRLSAAAREAVAAAGLGRSLAAIGGGAAPGFGLPPFPAAPSPLGLASSGSATAARRSGALLGQSLVSLGIDLVLGPRLDLATDPKDPAGALDGFGEDYRAVGRIGSAVVRGIEHAGVAACIGRFPGLGAVCADGYDGRPMVDMPAARLESCEMRPFSAAMRAGASAVLVGRAFVPSLESDHIPAASSARVIEGWLRDSLRFHGVVIGDDAEPPEEPGRAAVLSALAGCDLCLISRTEEALAAALALERAAAAGELPLIRVETARRRVEHLASRRRGLVSVNAQVSQSQFSPASAARDVERGASLLRGDLTLTGASAGSFERALVLVFAPPPGSPDAAQREAVVGELGAALPGASILEFPADPSTRDADELLKAISGQDFDEVAILTYDAHFRPAQEGLAQLAAERIPRFRVIAMRDPYDAAFFPKALGLGAVYGFSALCARAAAKLLTGRAKARGGRPVEVIGLEV